MDQTIVHYVTQCCEKTKAASPALMVSSSQDRNRVLKFIAQYLLEEEDTILQANAEDICRAQKKGTRPALIDRLRLTTDRICAMAQSLDELIKMQDPLGSGDRWIRPNNLEINRVRVPLGVIGIIYEARPNVTIDAAALCIKSGNAVVLRGGSEAISSNRVLVKIMQKAACDCGFSENIVTFIENTNRDSATALMQMRSLVDVLIPRGSAALIQSVVQNAKVPTIETGAGNCHLYVDASADIDMAVSVAINAKVSRPSVCNAIETILVHENAAAAFFPAFLSEAQRFGIAFHACEKSYPFLEHASQVLEHATEEDYFTEYGDLIAAVKIVSNVQEAIDHINHYGTGHSEAIITKDMDAAALFEKNVDCAAVYVNASTRFTDGGEFGFGAEIGISTQKLHARGPMGLDALTTQKYIVRGNGQIR